MGNTESSSSGGDRKRPKRRNKEPQDVASRAKQVVGESVRDFQANIQTQIKQLEEQDHPAAHFLDSVCGAYMDDREEPRRGRASSFYSEEYNSDEDDDRTYSEDETTTATDYKDKRGKGKGRRDDPSVGGETASYLESDYESQDQRKKKAGSNSFDTEDDFSRNCEASEKSTTLSAATTEDPPTSKMGGVSGSMPKPLASSFAKRCYFTKAGIGPTSQHYEGLTLTGNVVLMLAQAMKLKGCPTICDEDLRRVEQTYPNQFSRLPDELLLSSGWRRISKYCHFSLKPIPDGIPFFHSKQRLHPTGGYYFLLAAAVGMVRPIDVEPLTRDTLVLLETDFPSACDSAPNILIEDPEQWTLVDKFCFFSGGPINTDEDVYYQADFDGNPIYMLAFLSPSLTPNELYKLDTNPDGGEPGLPSVAAVQEVEAVYDLTDRDFDDLRLYHLGPCRALPQYILQPNAWTKILPPHFLDARDIALQRAEEYEMATYNAAVMEEMGSINSQNAPHLSMYVGPSGSFAQRHPPQNGMQYVVPNQMNHQHGPQIYMHPDGSHVDPMLQQHQQQQMAMHMLSPRDFGYPAEDDMVPMDEAQESPSRPVDRHGGIDPPDDEPPSLTKRGESVEEAQPHGPQETRFIHQDMRHDDYGYGYSTLGSLQTQQPPLMFNLDQHQQFGIEYQDQHVFPGDGQQTMPYEEPGVPMQSDQEHHDTQRQPQLYDGIDKRTPSDQHYPDAQTQTQYENGSQRSPHQEQRYASAPRQMQFQEEIPGNATTGQRFSSAPRQLQYHEDQLPQYQRGHSLYSNSQVAKSQSDQLYPGTERSVLQYQDNHKVTSSRRYSSAERQRVAYLEEQSITMHQHDNRHSSAERQRLPFTEDRSMENQQLRDNSYLAAEQHETDYEAEDQEHPGYQNYEEEPEEDAYYGTGVPLENDDHDRGDDENYQQMDNENYQQMDDEAANETEEPDPDVEGPISPQESLRYDYSSGNTEDAHSVTESTTEPSAPASQVPTQSEYSHTSSAMRGARELLKRNRQKRLGLAARRSQDQSEHSWPTSSPKEVASPQSEASGATWESGSEVTSVISATSSAWTENSGAPERSSRRALILQMAKARMKNNKGGTSGTDTGNSDILGTFSITEEEKKLDGPLDADDRATDIDIAGDLD